MGLAPVLRMLWESLRGAGAAVRVQFDFVLGVDVALAGGAAALVPQQRLPIRDIPTTVSETSR